MALETLKGLTWIDGFPIIRLDEARDDLKFYVNGSFDWGKFDEHRKSYPVSIADGINTISFRLQSAPVKEVGVDGCQVDTLIAVALTMVQGLNKQFPHHLNGAAIEYLGLALDCLKERKAERERRGVEGTSKI